MTRQLAMEGAPHRIRANTISPGMIVTAATRPVLEQPELLAAVKDKLMVDRLGQPDDIAWVRRLPGLGRSRPTSPAPTSRRWRRARLVRDRDDHRSGDDPVKPGARSRVRGRRRQGRRGVPPRRPDCHGLHLQRCVEDAALYDVDHPLGDAGGPHRAFPRQRVVRRVARAGRPAFRRAAGGQALFASRRWRGSTF